MLFFYTGAYYPFCAIDLFVQALKICEALIFWCFQGYRKRREVGLRTLKSTRSQMFFRIGALENFAIFKGKQLNWSLVLIKTQTSRLATLLKKTPTQVFSFEYCGIFKNSFFDKTPPVAAFGPRHTVMMKLFLHE